ncbi:dynein regulatory complex protein 10-like [Genypterus blacodes]|uniref:dynein regulatory complex protein 10-like n=1 Tax=Genypterus blacodes TaxID=154954 RepID=UPI003F768721
MSAEMTAALRKDAASQVLSFTSQRKTKTKTRLRDVLKDEEPLSRKLLSSDAQRVLDALENCIGRVEIIAILPTVLAHLDRLSSGLEDKWKAELQKHRLLEDRLHALDELKQYSHTEQEGHVEEAVMKVRPHLERDIKDSVRDLLRLFRTQPDVGYSLRAELGVDEGQSESMQSLIGGLKKFYGQMTEKLLTSPKEERQQERDMQELFSCHERNKEQIAELEKKYTVTTDERDAALELSEKEATIEKLRRSLQQQKTTSDDMIIQIQQHGDKQCQARMRASRTNQNKMKEEIDRLTIELGTTVHEAWNIERELQHSNEDQRKETEFLLKEFDDDMWSEQTKLEEMDLQYTQDKEELKNLEEPLATLMVEFDYVQEELRLEEERQKVLQRRNKAASLIQAWWAGYCTRKFLKEQANKPKGKKGKGKGKGKGGKKGKGKKK